MDLLFAAGKLKARKEKLENDINLLLRQFEDETGIMVIDLSSTNNGERRHCEEDRKNCIVTVNMGKILLSQLICEENV